MKWLLLVLVVLVLVAVLWLRTVRSSAASAASRPHRLDDSLSTHDTVVPPQPDDPTESGPQASDTGSGERT